VADGVEESLLESMLPTHTGVGEEGGGGEEGEIFRRQESGEGEGRDLFEMFGFGRGGEDDQSSLVSEQQLSRRDRQTDRE
jgi:hypothetical protein